MVPDSLPPLAHIFTQVTDFRDPRGKRHPLPAILALVFLGLLARIREMAVLQRWAEAHWDDLREYLGFTRPEPPHATTISRALGACSLADFSRAALAWIQQLVGDQPLIAAVDAKTSCQGLGDDGTPVQTLTVFVHHLKVVIGQWSFRGEKTNESGSLQNHLSELLAAFPQLQLITGDAIYAQRPLAEALVEENCDYLVQVKGNQPDVQDAVRTCFHDAPCRPPMAETAEKKGIRRTTVGCGSI